MGKNFGWWWKEGHTRRRIRGIALALDPCPLLFPLDFVHVPLQGNVITHIKVYLQGSATANETEAFDLLCHQLV